MSTHFAPGGWTFPSAPVFVEGLGGGGLLERPSPDPRAAARSPTGARRIGTAAKASPIAGADPSLLLRHLAREAARALRVSRVGIWQFDSGTGGVRCLVRFDRGEGSLLEDRLFSQELAAGFRLALDRVTAVAVDDTHRPTGTAPVLDEWAASEGIRSVLVLPVREEGDLAGLVTFEEGRSPRSWTAQERNLAAALAHQVRSALSDSSARLAPPPLAPEAPVSDTRVTTGERRRGASAPTLTPEGRARSKTLLRRLPPLEGAALLAGERAEELLAVLEIQRGYLALLEESLSTSGEDAALVGEARDAGTRVEEGVRDFLTHLRKGIPRGEAVDLNRTIAALVPALAKEAGDGLRLRVAPSAESLPVEVDPGLLERALLHLVRNAREASEPGTDARISWGPVPAAERDQPASEPGLARIRVEDRGEGVPAEDLPWLFEPFFSSRRGDRPLRGIGLSVVQAVVEGYGGWVEVSSAVGEGTTVEIVLPLTVPPISADAGRAPVAQEAERDLEAAAAPARILVLEDEPLLARLLESTLSRSGYLVEVAAAPMEAERRWHRLDHDVDLVVAERTLAGGRSGVDAVTRWRREVPGLRLIVLDRHAPSGSPARTPEGEPVLTRPFEPADVLARVREALGHRRRAGRDPGPPDLPPEGSVGVGGGSIAH